MSPWPRPSRRSQLRLRSPSLVGAAGAALLGDGPAYWQQPPMRCILPAEITPWVVEGSKHYLAHLWGAEEGRPTLKTSYVPNQAVMEADRRVFERCFCGSNSRILCMYVCMYVCMYMYMYVYVYVYVYDYDYDACMCTYIAVSYVLVLVYAYDFVHAYVYVNAYVHAYAYVYASVCVCMYVYVCKCM